MIQTIFTARRSSFGVASPWGCGIGGRNISNLLFILDFMRFISLDVANSVNGQHFTWAETKLAIIVIFGSFHEKRHVEFKR